MAFSIYQLIYLRIYKYNYSFIKKFYKKNKNVKLITPRNAAITIYKRKPIRKIIPFTKKKVEPSIKKFKISRI